MTDSDREPPEFTLSPNVRSVISLILFMHLFCVGVCLFSVYSPSRAQQRLLGVLGPYTQFGNFDLDFAPYYLTRDMLTEETFDEFQEREYRVEALLEGGDPTNDQDWVKLGNEWMGFGESYRRLQRLAYIPVAATREERQSAIALNLARFAKDQQEKEVIRIRIRQHVPIPQIYVEESVEFDLNDPIWFRTSYEARIVGDSVLPVVSNNEAAPILQD